MNVEYRTSTATSIGNKKKSYKKTDLTNKETRRILLVDDDPDICMVYKMVLEDAGYECASYTDSSKVREEFRPNYYDLVILGIKMPVINGFELCKKIIEVDKNIEVLFITAGEEYHEEFIKQPYPESPVQSNIFKSQLKTKS
jgi:CheY-like chemotaxis protein